MYPYRIKVLDQQATDEGRRAQHPKSYDNNFKCKDIILTVNNNFEIQTLF